MPAAPLAVLVAAAPGRPGVEALLEAAEREARAGTVVDVLWTGDGLAALSGPWPARLVAAGVRTAICAHSARLRKVNPIAVPPTVRWSSLATHLREVAAGARLWSAFP
ncbi:MAG: hypothetical protein IT460_16580 [Planctomycetes bacterium]|nr:hypothetical protein [Planctomycetota bacterium]